MTLYAGGTYAHEDLYLPLQNEQQETAMKALESLCENSKDEAQIVTALRSVKTQTKMKL